MPSTGLAHHLSRLTATIGEPGRSTSPSPAPSEPGCSPRPPGSSTAPAPRPCEARPAGPGPTCSTDGSPPSEPYPHPHLNSRRPGVPPPHLTDADNPTRHDPLDRHALTAAAGTADRPTDPFMPSARPHGPDRCFQAKAEVWVPVGTCQLAQCHGAPITQSELLASDGTCQEVLDSNIREEGDVNTQSSSVEVGPPD